jgi:hypothetical protein
MAHGRDHSLIQQRRDLRAGPGASNSALPYRIWAELARPTTAGYVSGGTRNLEWVGSTHRFRITPRGRTATARRCADVGRAAGRGEVPECPIVGELVERTEYDVIDRG